MRGKTHCDGFLRVEGTRETSTSSHFPDYPTYQELTLTGGQK
jgi:hypothetical protein